MKYTYKSHQTIVIGSGAAGLNAAVSLVKAGQRDVAILTEGRNMGTSRNTGSDKQTYYKMTTSGSEEDSVYKMARILYDGQCVDGDTALAEAALSTRCFYHLVDIGVPFPHNGMGEYVGYKTDHDPNRRGSSAGPLTSKFMTECLWKEVERLNIPVYDKYLVVELLTQDEPEGRRARGVLALDMTAQEQFVVFAADNVVYATGGEAGMYKTSVYPAAQIGGMGLALRAGARGKNLTESQYGIASIKFRWNLSGTFQQVIPMYISTDQDGANPREFLEDYFDSPEKLVQAIFLKGYQWPFDPRKIENWGSSLIDILVYQETVLKRRRVFLDYRNNPKCSMKDGRFDPSILSEEAYEYLKSSGGLAETPIERLRSMNPDAIELYRSHNINLASELLEISVCAQHNNGGLAGNTWWESNIKHFFPVGEVNGSHGVYRPGGSALNAGQVGSLRAAQYIANVYPDAPLSADQIEQICGEQIAQAMAFGLNGTQPGREALNLRLEREILGARMSKAGAIIRQKEAVEEALQENLLQQQALAQKGICREELHKLYRLRDLLVSQQTYLEAIRNYIEENGKSRGSYLIHDATGKKDLECLADIFRFRLDNGELSERIQEITYAPEGCQCQWRVRRPLPPEDTWFEKVWRDYREGMIYKN